MNSPPDLLVLSRAMPMIPAPSRKLGTRLLLPGAILICAAALLAYAARSVLIPAVPVRIVPVVERERSDAPHTDPAALPQPRAVVQAPGWIEPDPYATTIPALAEGVVRDLLIVEGQRVEAGEVVARMVDDEARLALRRAEAEILEKEAEVARSEAEFAAAEARADELRDDLTRKRPLVERGAIGAAELTQLELRLRAAERGIAAAQGMTAQSRAALVRADVMRDEAALLLSRMSITAPSAGVVMQRLVEPGMRISMGSAEGMTTAVARIYDPARLQARVDVPVSDAGKVAVGDHAEVATEALPGRTFSGRIVRAVHEGNIQRNTVQFKVAIEAPDPAMKPEMLCRVRILGGPRSVPSSIDATEAPDAPGPHRGSVLLLPESVLLQRSGDTARVWRIDRADPSGLPTARMTEVGIALFEVGLVRITRGLSPGDRVVINAPPELREGSSVRILGEEEAE